MKWCCFFLIFSPLFAFQSIQDAFAAAEKGQFAVYQRGKILSLLHVKEIKETSFILEEITCPAFIAKGMFDWKNWVQKGAKGSTSWAVFEIDRTTGEVIEAFSYTKNLFLSTTAANGFLSTLFQAPLKALSQEERRKVGPPPLEGDIDRRPLWNPPMILDYVAKPSPSYFVASCVWPDDGSKLSKKTVELYFSSTRRFPFPYWIQVKGSYGSVYAKIINSGSSFTSPYTNFPRRKPRFIGPLEKKGTTYEIHLFCPKYFSTFSLYYTNAENALVPLHYEKIAQEKNLFLLKIDAENLDVEKLSLSLFPKENPTFFCTFFNEL